MKIALLLLAATVLGGCCSCDTEIERSQRLADWVDAMADDVIENGRRLDRIEDLMPD